jgi:predicted amidohydrolase
MPIAPPLPLAIAQLAPTGSLAAGLEAVRSVAAKHPGPGLLLLPEGAVNGYFAADPAAARASAIPVQALELLAAELPGERAVVLGFTELRDGALFNSAAVLYGGRVLGVCSKVDGRERGFESGTAGPLFQAGGLRFGVLICRDARSASAAARLAKMGAQVLLFPLNNALPLDIADRWRVRHLAIARSRAQETGCWVLTADVVCQAPSLRGYGCSVLVDPSGRLRAQVPEGRVGSVELTPP